MTSVTKPFRRLLSPALLAATLLVTAVLLLCSATPFFARNADFTGEWNFNEQKSKLGESRFRMAAQQMKVSKDGDALVVERTSNTPSGETATSTEKLTFDGKPAESTVFGNSKKKSTAAWSANGEELTINSVINIDRGGNNIEIKTVETWKLTDGGKTITIDYTATTPRGETKNTFVYDKK